MHTAHTQGELYIGHKCLSSHSSLLETLTHDLLAFPVFYVITMRKRILFTQSYFDIINHTVLPKGEKYFSAAAPSSKTCN